MTHLYCRPHRTPNRRTHSRRSGQILLFAVLLMIVIAVIGSSFAVLLISGQTQWAPLHSREENRITA